MDVQTQNRSQLMSLCLKSMCWIVLWSWEETQLVDESQMPSDGHNEFRSLVFDRYLLLPSCCDTIEHLG